MYREGYLVKCGRSPYDSPQLLFCVFEDGVVKYYSEKGGMVLGELEMAGHVTKVRVERAMTSKFPHRFTVSSSEVVRVEGRRMKLGEARVTEFAAPTNDLMKEWANSLHLWRRMNWKENVKFFDGSSELSQAEERETLELQMHTLKTVRGRSLPGAAFRKPFVNIMHGQPSPTIKKLRQMIRHTGSTACTSTA
ncbi:hypothetical protein BBO99_00000720 [Phytophthora kernoviae]|uniref:PH domain-containing protein n=2 Tax=Phytophthora kernoviae TaxID=325452 RepID=A0A421H256_9STRA|nr:hypothetical protein G195_003212 [Phytophthora kernoviae 00238/432]KAG2521292.1 hypothetical protein JM16_005940 [Phytophthora kernoviae]KAG2523844.1 hypothetical protein JM18_005599 [Phytophthora kernoviae]RLN27376.1 hypothetical protein BBI17_002736 [Phytophthora kernoviae]RLN85230.1 hypothetical protein BBO99_00000720 [Phytophthora kernoviae]